MHVSSCTVEPHLGELGFAKAFPLQPLLQGYPCMGVYARCWLCPCRRDGFGLVCRFASSRSTRRLCRDLLDAGLLLTAGTALRAGGGGSSAACTASASRSRRTWARGQPQCSVGRALCPMQRGSSPSTAPPAGGGRTVQVMLETRCSRHRFLPPFLCFLFRSRLIVGWGMLDILHQGSRSLLWS